MADVGGRQLEPEVGAGLSIREVSRLLAVPAPTIRSWERRYGVPLTPRSAGGHRRYSAASVLTLRRMRDEVARGHRAADAAVLVRDTGEPVEPHRSLIGAFLDAVERLDAPGAGTALRRATEALGAEDAICGVLFPAMRQVGAWWQTGRCDIGTEQLATQSARSWLHGLYRSSPAPDHPESIVLACGPRDYHTLAQEAMLVVLARRGWPGRLLGARTPPAALLSAAGVTGVAAVVVVSHLAVGRRAALEAMRAVVSTGVPLFYAGNAFVPPSARAGVPGTYLGEDLAAAAETIASVLIARRPALDLTGPRHAALS